MFVCASRGARERYHDDGIRNQPYSKPRVCVCVYIFVSSCLIIRCLCRCASAFEMDSRYIEEEEEGQEEGREERMSKVMWS